MISSPAHRAPGFEGLVGRTGKPPPTPGCWCSRQPGGAQDGIKGTCCGTIPVSPENLCPYRQPKGETSSQEQSSQSHSHSHTPPPHTMLSWSSPCSPGSYPELTVVPWGWVPCSPSSAVGVEFRSHHLGCFWFCLRKEGGLSESFL